MKTVIILIVLLASAMAQGACRSSYVCDDYGQNCRYVDICDSTIDLPSMNLPPIPPLPTIEIKPLPSMALPPIGTSQCRYMMVDGRWQNICY